MTNERVCGVKRLPLLLGGEEGMVVVNSEVNVNISLYYNNY